MACFSIIIIAMLLALSEGLNQEISKTARQNLSIKIKESDMLKKSTHKHPVNCKEALDNGHNVNGVYKVQPDDLEPFDVYCDMKGQSGWIVFQRRQDGSVDFYRGWNDYVIGFGNLTGEFWLGLEKIHRLTKNTSSLRIDMRDFEGNTAFAMYNTFRVLDYSTQYTLNLEGFSGGAGDSLTDVSDYPFFTKDKDNASECAVKYTSAGWYRNCLSSNLNGPYHSHPNISSRGVGVIWYSWKGWSYSLKFVEMKLL